MTSPAVDSTAIVRYPEVSGRRDVDTVPFVELFNRRLQAVVSSGSDINRVYVAFLEAGSGAYYSCTNHKKRDNGMPKHFGWILDQAAAQFGLERVARYLEAPGDPAQYKRPHEVLDKLFRHGGERKEDSGFIFSRFLNYLRFVELKAAPGPVPEMAWFVSR